MATGSGACPCTCTARPHLLHTAGNRRLEGRLRSSGSLILPTTTSRPATGRSLHLQVCAAKQGKKKLAQQAAQMGGQAMVPPTPPVDPDNAEFVLFIRAKKFPQWYPLSVVKGGSAANTLIRAMEYDFGKLLYGKTLIRNIGQTVYADRKKVEGMVKRGMPMLKNFSDFEYGFKIRDKTRPKDWYFAENITIIPPEDQLRGTVVDQLSDWWSGLFKGGSS